MKTDKDIEAAGFGTLVEGQQLKSISYEHMGQRITKEFYHSREHWAARLFLGVCLGIIITHIIFRLAGV